LQQLFFTTIKKVQSKVDVAEYNRDAVVEIDCRAPTQSGLPCTIEDEGMRDGT